MKTATSVTSNSTNNPNGEIGPRDGMASANHGNSHSPYCGEYTLFVRRNRIRNGRTKVHRGKSGSRRFFANHTRIEPSTNVTAERTFTRPAAGRGGRPSCTGRWQ